jgi:hypothetical protein
LTFTASHPLSGVVVSPFPAFCRFEPCSAVFRPFCFVRFVNVRYQRVTQELLYSFGVGLTTYVIIQQSASV